MPLTCLDWIEQLNDHKIVNKYYIIDKLDYLDK